MEPFEIKAGQTYTSRRWKGDRKVVEVKRHRNQDAVVHFIDLRTSRTGNAFLLQFAISAEKLVSAGSEVIASQIHLTPNEKDWLVQMATAPRKTIKLIDGPNVRALNGLVKKGMAKDVHGTFWTITDLGEQRCTTIY